MKMVKMVAGPLVASDKASKFGVVHMFHFDWICDFPLQTFSRKSYVGMLSMRSRDALPFLLNQDTGDAFSVATLPQ